MPRRFDRTVRDEWRDRMAGKSHTCEACCDGDCADCSGTCDCSKCHKGSNASVLDALESKTAGPWSQDFQPPMKPSIWDQQDVDTAPIFQPGYDVPGPEPVDAAPSHTFPCAHCGNSVPVRGHEMVCPNCGTEHGPGEDRSKWGEPQGPPRPLSHVTAAPLTFPGTEPVVEQAQPDWGGVMEQPRVEPEAPAATPGHCTNCGTPMPYAGPHGNQYCPNCHMEHDPHGRPLGAPPAPAAQGHPREGEPLSQFDEPAARWGKTAAASMPPEGAPYQQKETALPYNPEAYESQVNDMHPAAQYTYQRAVAQGADPQAAYQAAQEKQGEMGKRTQEGQNTQGVQIPVINTSYHGDSAGFVSAAVIKRVSHLL